jgi:hypothetical protein
VSERGRPCRLPRISHSGRITASATRATDWLFNTEPDAAERLRAALACAARRWAAAPASTPIYKKVPGVITTSGRS